MSELDNCNGGKRSSNTPVIHDPEHALVHDCRTERGGTTTIGVPQFSVVIDNLPDPNGGSLYWRDNAGHPVLVQEDNGEAIIVDNI